MRKLFNAVSVFSFLLASIFLPVDAAVQKRNFFHGINLAGAGFGGQYLPGKHGVNYLWPTPADIDTYADMGANIFRVSFLWERIQPTLNGSLDINELDRLDKLVDAATAKHLTLLLDVHNFGVYNKKLIGSKEVPISAFVDLWSRLAERYRKNSFVAFGLMNEPYLHKADAWAEISQAAIYGIRKTGANQLILVPGTKFSAAYKWNTKDGRLSNAEALQNIDDPSNNLAFEAHIYFDSDSSGTNSRCVSADIGKERLVEFTAWLKKTGHRGFLGEFGASKDPVCIKALDQTLRYMADYSDVWYGWTYWAAAKWFGDYMFNVYPPDSKRFPQVEILKKAMSGF